ncbi:DUF3152 domain-containing protein [Paractinoplanes globisporus]|uniref:DUF3152 domain-containing protein n=1 Tax=Paractinoplanes globisporus TaxID=113565 RepID=A0ABW6WFN8_9ACTN|nr:DUF3152 domain-containing protein [Actinoplanes globisporus]
MISQASLPPAEPDHWRRWWLVLLVFTIVTASGLLLGHSLSSEAAQVPAATPSVSPSPSPSASASPSPSAAPILETAPTSPAVDQLRLPGAVPAHGSGKFSYAMTRGPVLGGKGALRRFRVAVEQGSNEDVTAFAEQVRATLGDPRSWIGGGQVRLQMVAGNDHADFTIFLATRDTAGQLCERGGTNIRIGGVPYTSCRAVGKVIINLDRWRLSAKPYVNAKIPLAVYRQYVINHEVGHELGHRHEGCPRAGGPAPVMVQQTLTTRGCKPYPWPRAGNGFLTGPAL